MFPTATVTGFAMVKVPLKIQTRGITTTNYTNHRAYEEICKTTMEDQELFYWKTQENANEEVFIYYPVSYSGSNSDIMIPKMNCKYYPVQNFNNDFLWTVYLYGNSKELIEYKNLRVSDANINANFVNIAAVNAAALFVPAQMQNDLGSQASDTEYTGRELIYSTDTLSKLNQWSKWEVHRNLWSSNTLWRGVFPIDD